ncbi:MAG: hypothetical protein OXL41_07610 [Nitrospinae bacterium]|nr:hypothetical protein [Nitrospinota bacterium]
MSESFGDVFPRLRRFIPSSLLDDPWWERLLERVGELPSWLTLNYAAFEFRLGEPAPATDYFVSVAPGRPSMEYFVRVGESARPDSAAAALGRLYSLMNGAGPPSESSLAGWFRASMLEYDIAEVPRSLRPAPGVFLALQPQSELDEEAALSRTPRRLAATIVNAVGWEEDEVERLAVERVFDALPRTGVVDQIGAVPERGSRSIRLIVDGVKMRNVPAFLKRLKWDGSIQKVMEALEEMRDMTPVFRLALDVAASGVGPRLGIEMYRPRKPSNLDYWLTSGRNAWLPVVDYLEEMEWCLPEKGDGLRAFPGIERLFEEKGMSILYKGINHFKLTIEGEAIEAKAYAALAYFRLYADSEGEGEEV